MQAQRATVSTPTSLIARAHDAEALPPAVLSFIRWARNEHGALTAGDHVSLANLLLPISLPTNRELESLLNEARVAGCITPEINAKIEAAVGKLAFIEQRALNQLRLALRDTPLFSKADDKAVDAWHGKKVTERDAALAIEHARRRNKDLAITALGIGAFAGAMFVPGAKEALQANLPDWVAGLAQMGAAFGSMWGTMKVSRWAIDPAQHDVAMREYGVHD